MDGNIFRQALEILHSRRGDEMSEEEEEIVAAAMIPLNMLPEFNDKTTDEGLEVLAKIVEEARG